MSFLSQPFDPIAAIFGTKRMISTIQVQVVINEHTTDTLTVTKQPVQQGASITDHAYLEPTVLSMTIYFAANLGQNLSDIYTNLQNLQALRDPFTITTPKRIYNSMLMTTLSQTTDKNTENTLAINMSFQQLNIVTVGTSNVPRRNQKSPQITGATQNAGQKQSFLYTGSQAIQGH